MRIITLQTTNRIKVVRKGLENFRADIPKIARQRFWDAMKWIKKKLSYTQTSPPRRPAQTYIRTFTLMRGYKIGKTKALNYFFRSTAPYTVHVLGGADGTGQAWMHEGRWPTMRGVVDWVIERLPVTMARGIRLAAKNRFKG